MKKPFWAISVVLLLVILAVWSPWKNLDFSIKDLLGLTRPDSFSGLIVYSLGGNMTVSIDGEIQGEVNLANSPLEIEGIKAGEHLVELTRESSLQNAYEKLSRKMNFEQGVNSILGYELGPTTDFSAGYIFYAASKGNLSGQVSLSITSNPNAKVLVNGAIAGNSPLQNLTLSVDQKQTIKLEADGYETLEFDIFPDNQTDRERLKDYNLIIEANLFKVPINVTEEVSE
ncbi:MAG TPA: PEGA domain-containing protein [bacterium]|nr:PEGA domain-containing protein [bacterium]